MPEVVGAPSREPSHGYQLRVVQEVVLALLAKEPSHGYQLRARLQHALGPLGEAMNAGQIYVTLDPAGEGGPGDVASGRPGCRTGRTARCTR